MNSQVMIKTFDPETYAITPVAPVIGENPEYAWAPDGGLFRAQDNILYYWKKDNDSGQWTKALDMSGMFNGTIGRMAISPDGTKIALVETS